MNKARSVLCLLAATLAPSVLLAQTAAPPRGMSQLDAVSVAVQNNPSLHVALLRASQGRYYVRAEEALYTPIFDADASITHTRSPSLFGTEEVRLSTTDTIDVGAGLTKGFDVGTVVSARVAGQRSLRSSSQVNVLGDITSAGPGYSVLGQLSLTQPLLRGLGRDVGLASLRQARLSSSVYELAAQETASAMLGDVVGAYWELWYASEVVRINLASQELALVQETQARQQVESGALAPASALPYITRVAELEEAVLSARTELRQRELLFTQLLGEVGAAQSSPVATDAPLAPVGDEPVEARATAEALDNSYARKQLQLQVAIAKDQLTISGDPLSPRLDLDAYVQVQGLGNRRVPPAFEQAGRLEAVSAHVGLTFEMPITDTRRAAQVQAAMLSQRIAEKQVVATELQVRASVASAIARRRAARERVALADRTEKVAREQAEAERARFQAGSSIAISVQEAEDSLRQAQLRAQRARVDLVLADLDLTELRGQLLTRYTDALQQLPQETRFTLTNAARSPL